VSRIAEHYLAKTVRRHGGIDRAVISERHHRGQLARMVYVRVGKANSVYIAGGYGQVAVFIYILALLHSAIHENMLSKHLNQRTRTGYLMCRSQKRKFHRKHPQYYIYIYILSYFSDYVHRQIVNAQKEKKISKKFSNFPSHIAYFMIEYSKLFVYIFWRCHEPTKNLRKNRYGRYRP
jgi:hypothetical protein